MKKIYIKPDCNIVRIYVDAAILAGSPGVITVNPPTDEYDPSITSPEYDNDTETPSDAKFNPGWSIWDDEE